MIRDAKHGVSTKMYEYECRDAMRGVSEKTYKNEERRQAWRLYNMYFK